MSASAGNVVEGGPVIVSPKVKAREMKFRWDPELVREIEDIAARTHRTLNECGELLMRWAVERSKQELELLDEQSGNARRKKQQ
jgi:hypothetical protein